MSPCQLCKNILLLPTLTILPSQLPLTCYNSHHLSNSCKINSMGSHTPPSKILTGCTLHAACQLCCVQAPCYPCYPHLGRKKLHNWHTLLTMVKNSKIMYRCLDYNHPLWCCIRLRTCSIFSQPITCKPHFPLTCYDSHQYSSP